MPMAEGHEIPVLQISNGGAPSAFVIAGKAAALTPAQAKRARYVYNLKENYGRLKEYLQAVEHFAVVCELSQERIQAVRVAHDAALVELSLKLEEVDALSLVKESCEAFEGQAASQKIHLISPVGGTPAPIRADGDRLLQVLANLLSNALKFTPQGGEIRVAVKPGHLPGGRDAVAFEVADTGAGIPSADLDKLFRKFAQAGEAPTGRPRGTGLGLVVAREIVELHGGRMGVESSLGRGSCFCFSVPVRGPLPPADPS